MAPTGLGLRKISFHKHKNKSRDTTVKRPSEAYSDSRGLPVDLKILILERVPDAETLRSLILSSRAWHDVFKAYEARICRCVLMNEFDDDLALEREASLLDNLSHAQQGNTVETATHKLATLKTFLDGYHVRRSQENSEPLATPHRRRNIPTAEEDVVAARRMMRNQRTARTLVNRCIARKLCDGNIPTRTERHRTTLAVYRLWIIITVCSAWDRALNTPPYSNAYAELHANGEPWHHRQYFLNDVVHLLRSYPFWEGMGVLELYKLLMDELQPHNKFVLEKKKQGINPWMGIEMPPFETQFYKKWGMRAYKDHWNHKFTNNLLLRALLPDIVGILTTDVGAKNNLPELEPPRSVEAHSDQFFPQSFARYLRSLDSNNWFRQNDWELIPAPARRVCRRGDVSLSNPESCSWALQDGVDLHACLLDDCRLEEMGYQLPIISDAA